ncbi:MAG: glycosyltransferase [Microbacteriaceae bacterium]|nr:glycosyltransferase [Microbacteriaceae bacterium]
MKKPLALRRVAMISTSYAPWILGGAERSLQELAEELTSQGISVRILTIGPKSEGTTVSHIGGVEIIRFGSRAFIPFQAGNVNVSLSQKVRFHLAEMSRVPTLRFLRRELVRFNPDVVHLHNLAGIGWVAWLAVRGLPSVQSLRDYYLICLKTTADHNGKSCAKARTLCGLRRLSFRLCKSRPTVFAAVSDGMVRVHRAAGSVTNTDEVFTVYNQPTKPARLENQTEGREIFGLFGTISHEKGTWVAVEAFKQARDLAPSAGLKLIVAGTGSTAQLLLLAAVVAEDRDITAVGVISPEQFYSLVNAVIVPTQWEEPFGRVAAETLLAGRTLIASAVGGLPEVTKLYGGNYLLVNDFRNVAVWADSILEVFAAIPNFRRSTIPLSTSVSAVLESIYLQAISMKLRRPRTHSDHV